MRRSIFGPAAVLVVAVTTGGWFLQQGVRREQNVYFQARLFEEVVDRITSDYVDDIERNSLYPLAIEGMLEGLGDPNTSYLTASEYENLRIRTQGDYGGVGLHIGEYDGFVTVIAPISGTPGARAGLRRGDQFVEIDGQDAAGWDAERAAEVLRGRPGTDVEVKVLRVGVEQPVSFTLTRERIQLKSVPFALALENGIAYVPLRVVSETSSDELIAALDSLAEQGSVEGIVLDLRGNPGGLLEQGIAVSDLFLPDGAAIVETRGRGARQSRTFEAEEAGRYRLTPIAVLVDEASASASEIIAGALQDHDRAIVVGMPTFGKGSVQTLFRLNGGSVLRLTTARWYTPVGRSIEKRHDETAEQDDPIRTLTLEGRLTAPPSLEDRPVVRSHGGRILYAGGGITPDVLVMADTLTTVEQRAVRLIDRHAGEFERVLFDFGLRVARERLSLEEDFTVTDRDLNELYDSLGEVRDLVGRADFRAASRFVRHALERQIAAQKWGEAAEFRRRMPYDHQLRAALDLLGQADSPDALFRLVGEVSARAAAPGGGGGRSRKLASL